MEQPKLRVNDIYQLYFLSLLGIKPLHEELVHNRYYAEFPREAASQAILKMENDKAITALWAAQQKVNSRIAVMKRNQKLGIRGDTKCNEEITLD